MPPFIVAVVSCRGIEQNLEKAHEYFDRGVKMLDLVSTSLAGNLLMRGAGVEADYAKALSHFTKSQVRLVRSMYHVTHVTCLIRMFGPLIDPMHSASVQPINGFMAFLL